MENNEVEQIETTQDSTKVEVADNAVSTALFTKKKNHAAPIIFLALAIAMIITYATTGFLVVQPIGAIPDGITVWYTRSGTDLPFITSPDGRCLDRGLGVSLMNRGFALSAIMDQMEDNIIARLPYMKTLYLISTDGAEYEN